MDIILKIAYLDPGEERDEFIFAYFTQFHAVDVNLSLLEVILMPP